MKVDNPTPKFYEYDEYARLVTAAKELGPRQHVMVLLGGDAGFRRGEMIALRRVDVDKRRKQLKVELASWYGHIDVPKSGHGRIIPMTKALDAAIDSLPSRAGTNVLTLDDGSAVDQNVLQDWMHEITKRAGLTPTHSLHILRYTFCSHLAMKGAPAKTIQELAGHSSLTMTMRYMHLAKGEKNRAVALLGDRGFGETVEKVA